MRTRRPRGFSLLEILVAVALLGMLLLALNVFIFSMGEIWGRNSEQRLFDQHVRAVTRHVENLLRSATLSPAAQLLQKVYLERKLMLQKFKAA